ncbi:FAD-dependent monooxygenase [Chelatococcus asaccharovorans]|uniref:2-polyprenyl-6-methoxyphenol hydroxylase-like FAD-dependent oxidoreductase n=1 Tax=Chelatococcus asaccharovorans TaxID=28210 RepID=A0A2V3TR35_9HYPH|nr:FAD-dependent monooxygenase [Chelatococcus asaccharovorans]MBS7707859.1 FAD-dependent monooxygenase [Chelatococcus asaccharovorans]PXW50893.1 2-polyprenyl-6-methoxyphenol hydroxylase-like FAD-dependent oxidoreductase [Chelatococcus asaccharovorans]
MKNRLDVIVVGAGPVGLWIGCELKLAGIDVAVIERRCEPTTQSRALTIHGRSLEVFALRGIADRLLATGRQIPTGHYAVLDTRLDFSPFDTRFPYTLFMPQAVTEAKLEEHALELGVDLRRSVSVQAVADKGDRIHVATDIGELIADYVVGADGARSIVREQASIAYEGHDARNTLMLGDVVLDAPPSAPVVSVTNEHGLVMVAPLGDGKHHRIVMVDPEQMHVPRTEPVTLDQLATPAARIAGQQFGPRDPIWMSRFTDETRLASTYNKGRILLAGDAAHIHAPMGGQGMNVGLQDAMNLGWKLAAVVKGEAPASLLDTYTAERRPVGEALYANTLAQIGLVTRFDPATLALRATLNDLLRIPAVNRRLAGELSGFDVAYGREATEALSAGRLAEGVRIPDIDVIVNETMSAIYSLLAEGNWLHIAFEAGAQAGAPDWLRCERIRSVTARPVDHAAFRGLRAVLVRPDGYVSSIAE